MDISSKITPCKIDVVILFWNRWQDTLEAIESALRQEGDDIHIYVVDQKSDADQFAALSHSLATKAKVELVKLDRNLGVPGGRNFGVSLGRGEIIIFLDNDAEFGSDDVCARTAQIFDEDPTLGALAFHIVNATTGLTDYTSWNHAQDATTYAKLNFQTARFTGAGCAVKRDAFITCGGFDAALTFMEEEKDLGYRIINQNLRIMHRADLIVCHKISPEKRIDWSKGRTYFLCRNIVLCEMKYESPFRKQISHMRDALSIARRKGHPLRGLAGIIAGFGLGLYKRITQRDWVTPLSAATRDYIQRYEVSHYGLAEKGFSREADE